MSSKTVLPGKKEELYKSLPSHLRYFSGGFAETGPPIRGKKEYIEPTTTGLQRIPKGDEKKRRTAPSGELQENKPMHWKEKKKGRSKYSSPQSEFEVRQVPVLHVW